MSAKKQTKLEALRANLLWRLDCAARAHQKARLAYEEARVKGAEGWCAGHDRGFELGRCCTLEAEVQNLADWLEVAVPVWFIDGTVRLGGNSMMASDARCAQWEWQEARRKASVSARLGLLALPPEDFVGRYAERVLFPQEVGA